VEKKNDKKLMNRETIRIAVLGPESTGKTTLVEALANYYNTNFVSEIAFEYLSEIGIKYNYEDYKNILNLQIEEEEKYLGKNHNILFFDTETINFEVWHEIKYGEIPDDIKAKIFSRKYDFYLLCFPDLKWEDNSVRENPEIREELFEIYQSKIISKNIPFSVVNGIGEERTKNAINAVEYFVNSALVNKSE
jgi:NadR type nicotinamide-nucleotide adenylyltransferase